MILDARGPNQVESTEQPWLRSMASVEQLQWLQLKADEDMTASTEDLREYYRCFEVEGDRVLRNALAMVLTPAEAVKDWAATARAWLSTALSGPACKLWLWGTVALWASGKLLI